MYRIMLARSGYYYVQRRGYSSWKMIGGFYRTRRGAERLAEDLIAADEVPFPMTSRVVRYY